MRQHDFLDNVASAKWKSAVFIFLHWLLLNPIFKLSEISIIHLQRVAFTDLSVLTSSAAELEGSLYLKL